MGAARVNSDYLSELAALAVEFRHDGLVGELYERLLAENARFLASRTTEHLSGEERRDLQNRAHALKNNYFNLGCEAVGRILDEMHEALKCEHRSREVLAALWSRFEKEASTTVALLRHEIAASARGLDS